ncbi:DUF4345 domain-containing protein [Emcibacter sp.]|uniref:DUF4345 domain-containing protein n=1 Tax=Emcibacter sp. TaxID=1979954 RepID=UPI002AA8DFFB|nr:DUF4345 domain-containing protein [Emcibacter sp.]
MNTPVTTKVFLAISGIILIGIGGALMFIPVAFQASVGIALGDNINLLSETRAPGGFLFAAGIIILTGSFRAKMVHTSLVLSSLVYLSYGISRILSIVMDGVPDQSLIAATAVEIIIGAPGLFLLYKFHKARAMA